MHLSEIKWENKLKQFAIAGWHQPFDHVQCKNQKLLITSSFKINNPSLIHTVKYSITE